MISNPDLSDTRKPLDPALYIISTPIGNMRDITLRALDIINDVDVLLSEDIRITKKILNAYQIKKDNHFAYRDENKDKMISRTLSALKEGHSIGLVSDAGTPLISDPGFKLVDSVVRNGFKVFSVPGPSAVLAALSVSGLPTDKFTFVGFLPKKGGIRKETLEKYGNLDATLVIYESPHRVIKTLKDISSILGNRTVCIARELTKLHEQAFYGKVDELLSESNSLKLKGEFVLLVAKEEF